MTAAASKESPKVLIGASIPRSGHHFLADMMTAYYRDDIYYCEYYTLPTCCKSVPCTRRDQHKFIYQKSHDRDFSLRADVGDALYLIQYRHPVPEALSDRELELKEQLGRPPLAYRQTREGYAGWLASKALYYRKFHDKWIAKQLSNAIYLDYADLAANARARLKTIVEKTSGAADDKKLDKVIEKTRSPRSNASFKPRVVEESVHFDKALLAAFEAWVLERCPRYNFSSQLGGDYIDSEIYGLILLKDPKEPLPKGETKRLKYVAKIAPNHPELLRRLAGRAIKEGRVAQGIKQLEKLIAAHPYFPDAYGLMFTACANSETRIPESVLTGNALIACSEDAELAMKLGAAFGEKGLWINALAAFGLATVLKPENRAAAEQYSAAIQEAR